MPSSTNDPNASASAIAQSISSFSSIDAACRELALELGVHLEALGPVDHAFGDARERLDRYRGGDGVVDRRQLGVVFRQRAVAEVVVVGLGGATCVRLLEGAVEADLEVVLDRLLVVLGDVTALHELLRVERAHGQVLVDELVHAGLGEGRLVGLVVPVAPVAEEVDDDVLLEAVAELEGELHHPHRGFGVVAVHVEDRRLHHLGDVGGVDARPAELGCGGEPELVVHDDVHGAADLVAGHLGEVERLGDHTLTGERGVAVQQHREDRAAGVVGGGVADRARDSFDHRARPPRGGWGWRRG